MRDKAIEIAEYLIDSGQFMMLPMLTTRQEAIEKLASQIRERFSYLTDFGNKGKRHD